MGGGKNFLWSLTKNEPHGQRLGGSSVNRKLPALEYIAIIGARRDKNATYREKVNTMGGDRAFRCIS